MATLQKSFKTTQFRLIIGLIVACLAVAVLLMLCRGKAWGHRRVVFENPQLLVVRYRRIQNVGKQVELVDLIPLEDIVTLESMNDTGEGKCFPTVYGISVADEEVPIIRVLPLKLSGGDNDSKSSRYPETYRINVLCDGELFVYDDVEYNGEDYMSVAHGKDWYMAITRRIK